ncbi:MAG: VOC family protein [Pseudomonadota bacterium]
MVTLVVPEMDEAIDHYTRDWGFELAKDTRHQSGHRWVEMSTGGLTRLRLAEARDDNQRRAVGNQCGGSVAFFLNIADFHQTIARWAETDIEILEAPRDESYGRVIVVSDRFGNRWDVFDKDYTPSP